MDIKALRQKILDLAIRGKLVPQDPNDEPASVLLERIREQKKQMVKEGKLKAKDIKNDSIIFVGEDSLHYEKFADGSIKCIEDEIPFELPDGWAWARLNQIYNFIDYRGATPNKISSGVPLITAKNVKSGYIDYTVDEYISEEEYWERQQRGTSRLGDILFTTEAPLGNAAIANIDKFSAGQRLITFQHYGNCTLNNITFLYFILSDIFQNQLHTRKTGSTVVGIKAAILKTLVLPVPPLKEQEKICDACGNLLTLIGRIASDKQDILSIISKTRSKILDLAIRGQLVPHNPDDEPASVLLERIRAEKEELIKQGKIKRDKKESIIFKGEDNSYYEKIGKSVSKIDAEIPFTLPNGWKWCKLGSLCSSIQYGLSNSAESSGTHKLLRITDIQNGSVNWDTVPYTTIEDPETYILKSNDIVFARTGATVGKSFLIDQLPYESVYASFLIRIRLLKFISPKYIYNFFNSPCYWEQISNKAVGVGQPNCNGTSLSNLFIPIPPAEVQDKIVSSISKLYEHIDSIEKSLS
ncbi:restriction endonuclease subunit S [Blautia sp. HCP3S3_C12]|uniref:restriction endonuclease subunit S n=1 Tax=unclassified Blautia TaxID=2648079 RepID=UPI003F8AB094